MWHGSAIPTGYIVFELRSPGENIPQLCLEWRGGALHLLHRDPGMGNSLKSIEINTDIV